MKDLRTAAFFCLVALAAMLVGCGDADRSTEPDADRTEGRIAYNISGMKKTASGAT